MSQNFSVSNWEKKENEKKNNWKTITDPIHR